MTVYWDNIFRLLTMQSLHTAGEMSLLIENICTIEKLCTILHII